MQDELENEVRKSNRTNGRIQSNLSKGEMEVVKWLQSQINQDKLAVVQTDKGGVIILTTTQLLKRKVLEKLEDGDLYEKIPSNPSKELHSELVDLWRNGKTTNLDGANTASKVMGISNYTNALSTHPHFRPGKSYFYPPPS